MSPNRLIPLLAAALPLAAPAQIVINEIAAATSDRLVRYDETGAPHLGYDPQWHHPEFDASSWPQGPTPIGSSGGRTQVSRDAVSLYARTTFQATSSQAADDSQLVLNVTYDDGFIAYINGTEVARSNLGPRHAVAYHDQPAYNPNPVSVFSQTLPSASSLLVEGENTLAIQTHASGQPGAAVTRIDASLSFQSPGPNLVLGGHHWHYFEGTTEPSASLYDRNILFTTTPNEADTEWKKITFDDSRWADGSTPIGFDTAPHYQLGTNLAALMRGRATSLFFRAEFDLTQEEIDAITSLTLPTDFDDGIALFLNGFEAGRANLGQTGEFVSHSATADDSHGARFDNGGDSPDAIVTFTPDRGWLQPGKNVLSVQVHNNTINSSDLFASVTMVANGLGRNLIADGHPVAYLVGTAAPTSDPQEPEVPETNPKKPRPTDWIELHNPTPDPVDLEGWSLTDSAGNLDAWVFPNVTIAPGAYLVVRASGRDETDPARPLQTNFRLSATGEFLALVRPDGTVADSLGDSFPPQDHFHTYGRDASGTLGYFPLATPGKPNPAQHLASILPEPEADLPTGFYPGHVTVNLQSPAPGTTIRYTTDGTDPTESNGREYTGSVSSNTTPGTDLIEGKPGSVLREIWTGVPGTSVSQIPTDTPPDLTLNSGALSTPPDWIDNFGDRFRGFLRPAVTGDYSFWISSSHSSELWVSSTNSPDDKQLVASVASSTNSYQWDKFPSQHSAPVRLESGKSYYFESLRKSGTGSDNLAIAWDGPGISRTVLFGNVIAPVVLPSTLPAVRALTLKARTFAPGQVPSSVMTRSYLINYDPRFAQNPALIISGDPERSLFNPNGATARVGGSGTWSPNDPTADYNFAMEEGRPYERPIVFEYLEPGGTLGFRNGAAVRIAGSPHARPRYNYSDLQNNTWLGSWTTKPSLNFFFRDELGDATVDYPLFGEDRVSRFGDFRLRAGKNDSANPFIKDEVMRRLSAATGQPASRGIFVNLFINGQYKAYFNLTERLRERFFQEHHNSSEGWDIWHIRDIVEGDSVHYNATMNLLRPGNLNSLKNFNDVSERVNLTSYIDYIIVNAYGATGDWPHNNYNLARERSPTGKWHFNVWDAEGAFGGFGHNVNWNTLQQDLASGSSNHMTSLVYRSLRFNSEFRMLFADRIQKHFFHDGGLTQQSIRQIYEETRDEFAPILRLARNQSVNEGFFNGWWPNRRSILFSHFRSQGMWPDILAPNFSKLPGEVAAGTEVFMANLNANGKIYFTTDGSDPRAPGGTAIGQAYNGSPVNVSKSTLVKARVRTPGGQWSPVREMLYTTPEPPSIIVSEIHYNPDGEDTLEYVELKNIGTEPVDLENLAFTNGVDFTFPGLALAPGALVVIVKDPEAFAVAFPGVAVAGTFTGSLDNAGERLTLSEPGGRTVFTVRYNDRAPWPTSADGDGFSLVLSDPDDPDAPASWRPSSVPGGTPGTDPISTFAAWQQAFFSPGEPSAPMDDPDGDLIPNVVEYALASSPLEPGSPALTITGSTVTYSTYDAATDVTVTLTTSSDLKTWQPVNPDSSTPNGDGTTSHSFTVSGGGPVHFRLGVTLTP